MRKSAFLLISLFLPVLMVSGSIAVTAQTPSPDINEDGKVDIIDALILAAAFNSRPDFPNWNPKADMNSDGSVDVMDVMILSNNYGREGPFEQPSKIKCVQWYEQRGYPYSSSDADISLANLKSTIPSCNYLHVACYLHASGDVVDPITTNATLDAAVQKATQSGYKILFRIQHLGGSIDFVPSNKSAWFSSFTEAVRSYAVYAEALGVEGFCLGVEFTALEVPENNDYWSALIDEIRSVYRGKLWYETNNWCLASGAQDSLEQKLNLTWFSKLDYIAVSAYWAVANRTAPTVQELVYGWSHYRNVKGGASYWIENPVEDLKNLSETFNKKILIVSGLWSAEGACMTPWASGDKYANASVSLIEQTNWYEALFQVFYDQSWVAGFEFDTAWCSKPNHEVTKEGFIIGKPAQDVVKTWFAR